MQDGHILQYMPVALPTKYTTSRIVAYSTSASMTSSSSAFFASGFAPPYHP